MVQGNEGTRASASFIELPPSCQPNRPHRHSLKRPTRRQIRRAAGSRRARANSKRPATSTSRQPMHSSSRSSSKRPATALHARQSAGSSAKSPATPPTHGGTPPRRTSEAIPSVRTSSHQRTPFTYSVLTEAIEALTQTIVHLTQTGRFRQAADREREIGQIYLQESHDLRKASESLLRAGDWYAQEDATA